MRDPFRPLQRYFCDRPARTYESGAVREQALALLHEALADPQAEFREGQWEAIEQLVEGRECRLGSGHIPGISGWSCPSRWEHTGRQLLPVYADEVVQ